MAVKKTYTIMAKFEGPLDEVLQHEDTKPLSMDAIVASMKELAFIVETVAHLQGKEATLLPSAEKARALIARLENGD